VSVSHLQRALLAQVDREQTFVGNIAIDAASTSATIEPPGTLAGTLLLVSTGTPSSLPPRTWTSGNAGPPAVSRFAASRAASEFFMIQYGDANATLASAIVLTMAPRSAAIAVAVLRVLVVGVMPFVLEAGREPVQHAGRCRG
jgi:hypothetical protein